MSTRLDPRTFDEARQRATQFATPATSRQQDAWLGDWKTALGRLRYLHVEQATTTDQLKTLIRIRGRLKQPNLGLELVKPDIERLWKETAVEAGEAGHCFVDSEGGFESYFFAVDGQKAYITGVATVLRHQS